jgi:hypothetical protein
MRPTRVTTTGVQASNPVVLDVYGLPQVSLQVAVNGAATFTVQQTLDNPLTTPPAQLNWFPHPDATLVGATGNVQGNYAFLPLALRLNQTAGAGSAVLTVIQAGASPS